MDEAASYLIRHGYAVLFVWVTAEQFALPVPSEPVLLAAGALARAGRLTLPVAVLVAVAGALVAAGLPIHLAIGTSLIVVASLGATTATSYALSGLVDWPLLGLLVLGGAAGSVLGMRAGKWLLVKKRALELGFATTVILVGAYVSAKAGGFA